MHSTKKKLFKIDQLLAKVAEKLVQDHKSSFAAAEAKGEKVSDMTNGFIGI